jgi:hypothetical protein
MNERLKHVKSHKPRPTPFKAYTPEWKKNHSVKNIKGLIVLQKSDASKAMGSARHLGLCLGIDSRGDDILHSMSTIESNIESPETSPETMEMFFQSTEWQLSQFVKEIADALHHASILQEYLHGARESNKTICQLMKERTEAVITYLTTK